jgi:hypothetical protein
MNILHIEVNDSGGWRRVMSFEHTAATLDNVQLRAAYLLMESDSHRIRARIIAPGDTAPLMTWTAADGWREWRA